MVRSRLPYDDVIMALFEDDLIQFAFFEVNPMLHFSGADASVTFVLVCLKERTWFKPIFLFIDYIILHYQIGEMHLIKLTLDQISKSFISFI